MMVMSTGARRRRRIRAIPRAQVNPVKPLPTITIEVTNASLRRLAGWVEIGPESCSLQVNTLLGSRSTGPGRLVPYRAVSFFG
jgi:hypothetical protein